MSDVLLELYRHKTWATLRIIEVCRHLDENQLAATTPGTYGTVRETLGHLVAADEGYLATATGVPVADPPPDRPAALDDLAARTAAAADGWERLARRPDSGRPDVTTGDGWRTVAAVPMAQAIHHADDHRSHLLSILGANGIEVPGLDIGEDLDVWHHAISTGAMSRA